MRELLAVKHNIEVAHRLYQTPGKCQNIHGHSMWVTLELAGTRNDAGMVAGLDFSAVKRVFRSYLDATYDHRLLLNRQDPYAGPVSTALGVATLPGLSVLDVDPTTENIAALVLSAMAARFPQACAVGVWETAVNQARVEL